MLAPCSLQRSVLVLWFAVSSVIGSAPSHAASAITLKARISHVTAFDDGAVVSFGGTVTLEQGSTVVTLTNLPGGFKLENARITGYGKARVTLLDADTGIGSTRGSRGLRLFCEVRRAGEFDFSVAYRDGSVLWHPDYVVRINTAAKKLSIDYAAVITQSTRDPWRRVGLTILPHRMGRGGALPRQDPWRLGLRPHTTEVPRLEGMQDEWSSMSDGESTYDAPWGYSEPEKANLFHAEPAKVYRRSLMPGDWFWSTGQKQEISLPANGRAQRVVFATNSFDCAIRLVAWPKLAKCVYRTVEMRNNSYIPLVAGGAEIFVDGARLGHLRIDQINPGDSLVLNLGVDDNFVVERPLIGDLKINSLGEPPAQQRATYEATATIENRHATRQVVEVHDQLPRSTEPAIVVEAFVQGSAVVVAATDATDVENPPETTVAPDGAITWTLSLEPGQKRTLPVKVVVMWPVGQYLEPWRFW